MSYSKLIHDYLDGELGQTQQDMLFAELANNAEARHEFNQQMKLHRIAQNDMSVIAPPVATTNAIFSQLGFSIPPAGFAGGNTATAAGAGFGTAILFFFRKYAANILTAVTGALLTGFIFFYLSNFEPDRIQQSVSRPAQASNNIPVVSSVENQPVQKLPVMSDNNLTASDVERMINSAMNKYMTKVDNYYKNYFATLQENNPSKDVVISPIESPVKQSIKPVNDNSQNEVMLYTKPDNINQSQQIKPETKFMANSQVINLPLKSDKSLFNLTARAYSTNSKINVDVPSKSNPWFSNMGLGFSYNLSDYHTVGIEVGQEAFPQSFTRTQYGEVLSQQQNPLLPWVGATYKYSMMNIFIPEVLYPYVEVLGGMTKVGPLGRAQVGMQFRPDKRVTFNLGAEGSILWYNVQGNVYDTKKIGLTYGVSIHY